MIDIKIVPITKISDKVFQGFLLENLKNSKINLINKKGEWLSKGNNNRFVLFQNNEPMAYFALIPTKIMENGKKRSAIWWIELVVSKKNRGKGYQTIIDKHIKRREEIKLGFPNKLAAKIHLKHNWNVRSDLSYNLYPIKIKSIIGLNHISRRFKLLSKFAALLLFPITKVLNYATKNYKVKWSKKSANPSPEIFHEIFLSSNNVGLITTWRNVDHFNYRYFSSPNRSQFQFYLSKKGSSFSHYCIARIFNKNGQKVMTILDLYGDLNNSYYITDLLKLVLKDALKQNVVQVTSLTSLPSINLIFKRCGFIFSKKSRFCMLDNSSNYYYPKKDQMHWTLGDSDNDIWN